MSIYPALRSRMGYSMGGATMSDKMRVRETQPNM